MSEITLVIPPLQEDDYNLISKRHSQNFPIPIYIGSKNAYCALIFIM